MVNRREGAFGLKGIRAEIVICSRQQQEHYSCPFGCRSLQEHGTQVQESQHTLTMLLGLET